MSFIMFLLEFLKIGSFTYGGGLAMIPILRDIVLKFDWLTESQFTDLIAISQSTPGPIAINMATYIGYREFSFLGALLASIVLILPAFILSILLGNFLVKYKDEPYVKAAFVGLKATIIGLVGASVVHIGRISLYHSSDQNKILYNFDLKGVFFLVFIFAVIYKTQKHPVFYVIASGIIGIFIWN